MYHVNCEPNRIVGAWSMYIPIQTNKPSIEIDEELMLDLKV